MQNNITFANRVFSSYARCCNTCEVIYITPKPRDRGLPINIEKNNINISARNPQLKERNFGLWQLNQKLIALHTHAKETIVN